MTCRVVITIGLVLTTHDLILDTIEILLCHTAAAAAAATVAGYLVTSFWSDKSKRHPMTRQHECHDNEKMHRIVKRDVGGELIVACVPFKVRMIERERHLIEPRCLQESKQDTSIGE